MIKHETPIRGLELHILADDDDHNFVVCTECYEENEVKKYRHKCYGCLITEWDYFPSCEWCNKKIDEITLIGDDEE